ncbi:MAG: toxic anion resistance protein, partial [Lachnospiraceae bacterium]|nr:toxic anion resistance protein [Lachnospiraceae bacterium]
MTTEMALSENYQLNEEDKQAVVAIKEKVDLADSLSVMAFGSEPQSKISEFSDAALATVRTKDLGEVGDMIVGLVGELKTFSDNTESSGFLRFFKKQKSKIEVLKSRYDKTEVTVEKVVSSLELHQVQLMKDVSTFDKLYDVNLENLRNLTLYVAAGKEKLEEARNVTLVELKKKAEESGLPEDAQKANDFASYCDRFEKRIYDLELTRAVAIQMAPQVRLVQNNEATLAEKIQSTIINTIPLWKSQMVVALGLANAENALEAERAVNNTTNALLKKNAEMLKTGSVEIAKENERGVVDIETLTYTNQQLIETLDEVVAIQNEGKEKRKAAEAEMARMEEELKQKL